MYVAHRNDRTYRIMFIASKISDTTDEISYKALMIADQDWFDFLDFVSELMEKEPDREKMVDEFYRKIPEFAGRAIYQC